MNYAIKENSIIARMAAKKLKADNCAIVLGSTIHLYNTSKSEFLQNKKWVLHEECHIAQFKKYGFLNFICRYLWESMQNGYEQNKYEIEARDAENIS